MKMAIKVMATPESSRASTAISYLTVQALSSVFGVILRNILLMAVRCGIIEHTFYYIRLVSSN